MIQRCQWCGDDPLMIQYHDDEWGLPVYDNRLLFAKLILDGAQAGLSWSTILKKRDNYWQAFDQFEPGLIARYNDAKVQALLQNPGIVRNRLKIQAAIKNARGFLEIMEERGSFSQYLWSFVGGKPIINAWKTMAQIPSKSPESEAMSVDLKARGFNFVGPTICYAFMQAVGMVNDHTTDCFRYNAVQTQGG